MSSTHHHNPHSESGTFRLHLDSYGNSFYELRCTVLRFISKARGIAYKSELT